MRILYLQQELTMPGARGNPRCWEMAKHFVDAGHDVTFVTSLSGTAENRNIGTGKSKNQNQIIKSEGITIHTIDVAGGHLLSFPRRIYSWLDFYRKAWQVTKHFDGFDIIIGYTAPLTMAALAQKLSKRMGIPYCVEVADVWPDVPIGMGVVKNRVITSWLYSRVNRIYDNAANIFPYTEGMRDQIVAHGDYDSKTHVLHNGVDCKKMEFHDRSRNTKPFTVIYAGTIGKANDLTQLVSAIKIIEDSGRLDLKFCIVGKGNDENRVKQLAEKLDVKSLKFLPPVGHEEVSGILKNADIGISCFASYPVLEANGATKFFDYLASGLPMVINYLGWQSVYLKDNDCGLFSSQGDDEAFAANILKLADSPELRSRFASNGVKLAEKTFDRKKIAVKYLELMQECINKKSS